MKKATALFTALLFCLTFSLTVFADDIFIIEDGEDEFVPNVQTTTQPAETTTVTSQFDNIIDSDKFGDYFNSIKDTLGNGLSSIMDGFGSWGTSEETTTSSGSSDLPNINGGTYTPSNQSASMTTVPNKDNNVNSDNSESTTSAVNGNNYNEEVPSVLIVNNSENDSWGISGSTLTLLIFIAAIVILVLVVVIVLIVMTRRTEFDSAVKNRSTLPSVEQPNSLAQFFEDDIPDDGNDYSNITYWNE